MELLNGSDSREELRAEVVLLCVALSWVRCHQDACQEEEPEELAVLSQDERKKNDNDGSSEA